MVEDEFHSVAQTFTQHLHHAEYQRLKKKARDAAPPTFQPTEHMRVEVKNKLEARLLRAKQKDAVGSITNGVNLSAEEDEEQKDDPWLGTSLAGLMTDANNQKRTALVGLEKIQSATRAARGFGRGTGDSPAGRKEKMSVFDIFGAQRRSKEDGVGEQEHPSCDDDLDAPSKAKAAPSRPMPDESISSREAAVSREPTFTSTPSLTTATKPLASTSNATHSKSHLRFREPSVAARRLFADFDNFETLDNTSGRAKNFKRSPSRRDNKAKQAKDGKMRMSDIPTFLV